MNRTGLALLLFLALAGCGTRASTAPLPTRTPSPAPAPTATADPSAERQYLASVGVVKRLVTDAIARGEDGANAFVSSSDSASAETDFDGARSLYEEAKARLDTLFPPSSYATQHRELSQALDQYLAANSHFLLWVQQNSEADFSQAAALQRSGTALFHRASSQLPPL